jgi:hypothetical protein
VVDDFAWDVRTFIYAHLAETTRAPLLHEIASRFSISSDQAADVLHFLHEQHALFLEAGTTRIRLANPFSAISTNYHVEVADKTYQANCAWDSFGIVAALHADEATIRSACTANGQPLEIAVHAGQVAGHGEVVHFLVPFRRWYDDLVFT